MSGCLTLLLVVLSFALMGTAQSAAAAEGCTDCTAVTWGPNVQLTAALTSGQPLKQLFWGNLTLGTAVGMWRQRIDFVAVDETGMTGVPKSRRDAAREALAALKTLIPAPAPEGQPFTPGNWSMKQLYLWAWNDLPGDAGLKGKILAQLEALRAAGMISLTFVDRAASKPSEELPQASFKAARACAKSPAFQTMTIGSFFYMPADPEIFDDDDIDLLGTTAGVLWDLGSVDRKNAQGEDLPPVKTLGMCCDRRVGSQTYRKCIAGSASNNCTIVQLTGVCSVSSTVCPN